MMEHLRFAQSNLSSLPTAGDMYHQPPADHQANNVTTMADLVVRRLLDDPRLNPPVPAPSYTPAEPPIPPPAPVLAQPPAAPLTDFANSLQRRETDLQSREASMMTQMHEMTNLLRSGNNNNNSGNNNNTNNTNHTRSNSQHTNNNNNTHNSRSFQGHGGGQSGGRTNNGGMRPARAYCWTHGSCIHTSANCNTPANGHQTSANFANMQNGSTHGCYWMG
jgi:type IV secretory pathway VirB10-like protein